MRMTAQRKTTYFPELEGAEQEAADEWLIGYLRLVMRIHGESAQRSYPQVAVDTTAGTGRVRTASGPHSPPQ